MAKPKKKPLKTEDLESRERFLAAELKRKAFLFTLLRDISSKIGYEFSYPKIIKYVLSVLPKALPMDFAGLLIETTERLEFRIRVAQVPTEVIRKRQQAMVQVLSISHPNEDIHKKYILAQIENNLTPSSLPVSQEVSDFQSIINVPLLHEGKIMGLLEVASWPPQVYNADDLTLLQTIANQLSSAVQRVKYLLTTEAKKMEIAVQNMPQGVLLIDAERNIVLSNPLAKQILRSVKSYDDLSQFLGSKPHELLASQSVAQLELTYEKFHYRIDLVALQDAEGTPIGTLITLRDITKEKKLEQLKTEFISMVSHELRTPLSNLVSTFNLLKKHPDQGEELGELAEENIERLVNITNDLLDLAQIETGQLKIFSELTDLENPVQKVIQSFHKPAKEKGITLETKISSELPKITADPQRVKQIVSNLIDNALKFTPPGGKITVNITASPKNIQIEVSDTGIGIPPNQLDLIFEKFVQIADPFTRESGGLGLGLPIVKQLVEAHGGRIWVESRVGKGSSFFVELPFIAQTQRKAA